MEKFTIKISSQFIKVTIISFALSFFILLLGHLPCYRLDYLAKDEFIFKEYFTIHDCTKCLASDYFCKFGQRHTYASLDYPENYDYSNPTPGEENIIFATWKHRTQIIIFTLLFVTIFYIRRKVKFTIH